MSKGANKEANIKSLYGELNKFGQNGEYEKALKIANKSRVLYYIAWLPRLLKK